MEMTSTADPRMIRTPESRTAAALPEECLYVYGIVDKDFAVPAELPADGGLQLTGVGRIAGVYSWLDSSLLDDLCADIAEEGKLATLARRHDEIVRSLANLGAVLPVRLGTLFPSVTSLAGLLRSGERQIAAELDRVRGRSEWNLRARRMRTATASVTPGADDAESSGTGRGTTYLLGRRDARHQKAALEQELSAAMTAVDDTLSQLADQALGRTSNGSTLSRAYLVSDSRQEEFLTAAAEAVTELETRGCEAVFRGPLPAYSFVDMRLEVAGYG